MNRGQTGRKKPAKGKVRVARSQTGRGIFANRQFRQHDLIGEIAGQLIQDAAYGSDYCFDLDAGLRLEPVPPFRFINHSCDPNCEFDRFDLPSEDNSLPSTRIFLFAARSINPNDQLTIDYNWAASAAIPCRCGAANCRGWIVDPYDLGKMGGQMETDRALRSKVSRLAPG